MNCLDLRRALLADPHRLGEPETEHLRGCDACQRLAAEVAELERLVDHAMRVPVPPGLERRLFEARGHRPIAGRRALLAAAFAAATIGVAAMFGIERNDPLALAGIDFVVREEAQAILESKGGDPAVLRTVAAELGVALPGSLGDIRYVGTCPFSGSTAHHVVVRTAVGKVTLLLLPDRPLQSRVVASDRGLAAAVRPAGRGSVAIVSDSPAGLTRTESLLRGRV
jgi:predicted anti-sigma-YlaC factor YlaD